MSKIKKIFFKFFAPVILGENKVIKNEKISPHFQLVTIKGKTLRKKKWMAGDKIKIQVTTEDSRSYTPCSWDDENGILQMLVYMHGKGPGALWARDIKENTSVTVLGPKGSLSLPEGLKDILFFGDETTYGLAHALKKSFNKNFTFYFEASDMSESASVLEKLELANSSLFKTNQYSEVSKKIASELLQKPTAHIVLSGKQKSIVGIREKLYELGVPAESISKKVYWGWKDDPNGKLKK